MQSPLLRTIDREHLDLLEPELQWVPLPEGDVLFSEGDPVDAIYFVIDGLLEVTKLQNQEGGSQPHVIVLAEIPPGGTIGEMQILTGGRRSATITAR